MATFLALLCATLSTPAEPALPGLRHLDPGSPLAGRVLWNALQCDACHADRDTTVSARGPRLAGIASRFPIAVVRRKISSPDGLRPGTRMPNLLHSLSDEERSQVDESIAAYLDTVSRQENPNPFPDGNADRGRDLYRTIGCFACHGNDPEELPSSAPRTEPWDHVALGNPASWRSESALATYLLNPARHRPDGLMPRVPLSRREAADLAAFLRRIPRSAGSGAASGPDEDLTPSPGSVETGRLNFRRFQCHACHDSPDASETLPAVREIPISDPTTGCLAAEPPAEAADYDLSAIQRQALRSFLNDPIPEGAAAKARGALVETLVRRNCLACHVRDDLGGPDGDSVELFTSSGEDLGNEGRFPPPLTHTGRKLTRAALSRILQGEGAIRPFLNTRMPDFGPVAAHRLPVLFETVDLPIDVRPTPRDGRENQVGRNMWGRELIGTKGLGCISCHPLNGNPSLGIQSVDLAHAPRRLRPEWFRDFLIDPARFRPGIRMPSFWPEGGPSLPGRGGTTERQIDSLWVYLNELDQSRLPEGLESPEAFELVPEDQPIVFRTFLEYAGLHAIAVGFPEGIHAAFDARRVRWAIAWKGRFLDATSTWSDRFTPLTKPLGNEIIPLDPGPVFPRHSGTNAEPDPNEGIRFHGYRLDARGIPTFLYSIDGVAIEDTLTPSGTGGILRRLRLSGSGSGYLRPTVSERIEPIGDFAWRTGDGRKWTLIEPRANPPERHVASDVVEIRIPTPPLEGDPTFTWRLEW